MSEQDPKPDQEKQDKEATAEDLEQAVGGTGSVTQDKGFQDLTLTKDGFIRGAPSKA